MVRLQGILH
uniref:Uncharacterized protein n=1 Tax=Oryza barthii TaxID=65489 RepID=A0A0G2KBM7_9ORYZ